MANRTWSVISESITRHDLTENEATRLFRAMIANFYNRDVGCTNGLKRHFSDIHLVRNGADVVEYNSRECEIYVRSAGRKSVFGIVSDWEDIFTVKPTKLHELYCI